MAPEQVRGERNLTPAADLFSLGCILYECLAGSPPFVAEHMTAVLVCILFEEPIPIAQRRPGIPASVSELVAGMLEKSAAKRIGDARQVAAALAAIGEVPDLPLQPTLASLPNDIPQRADVESEQQLLSLVLVRPRRDLDAAGPTLPSTEALAELERHSALLAELRSFGAQADLLLGGALVVRVPQLPSARDQAALAARCAVTVRERWPKAGVAVVTGRGSRSGGLLTGEVLDRAWRLLSGAPGSGTAAESSSVDILIDEVSAGLLETRFELRPSIGQGFILGSERLDEDAARLLLGKPTPCVGRERELATLEATFDECRDESVARAVLLLAPPGLGKSRLRHQFLRRLLARAEPVQILIGRGDPMKAKSSYGLLGEALRGHCGMRDDQDLTQQQAHLRDWVTRHLDAAHVQRVTEFLGELCGIAFPDAESPQLRAARQDPRIMLDQVEQAWIEAMRAAARQHPVLLILEDLHWADALTVKLTHAALRGLAERPFMALALARPEVQELYPNLWAGMVQAQPLHPLPRKAGERLARQILGSDASPGLIGRLVEQSAGNPLFLEELIRAAAEGKTGEVPGTVAAMIQARIGRLDVGTRRAMRAASVFGETFFENGVRKLLATTHGSEAFGDALAELIREEIIEAKSERRFTSEPEYRFRHALVRDAAYGLVNAEEAAAWHAAAGAFLEAAGERMPIILAAHYQLGQKLDQATGYYFKAAEQALDAGDREAALAAAEQGLACGPQGATRSALQSIRVVIGMWRENFAQVAAIGLESLGLVPAGSRSWCRFFEALFPAVVLTQPAMLPSLMAQFLEVEPKKEARVAYVTAAAMLAGMLCVAAQKQPALLLLQRLRQITTGLADDDNVLSYLCFAETNFDQMIMNRPYRRLLYAQRAIHAAAQTGNRQLQSQQGVNEGQALFHLGQRVAARKALASALALAQQVHSDISLSYGRVEMARLLAWSPAPDELPEAEALALQSMSSGNPHALGWAHSVLAQIALRRGDLEKAESAARTACEILNILPACKPDCVALYARILAAQGKHSLALQICEATLREQQALEIEPYGIIDLYVALAEARQQAGLNESARQAIEQALPILHFRMEDIPDAALRAAFVQEVPGNARLLALAEHSTRPLV